MRINMRICIVAEGCYPYVVGGVSGWINSLIQSFPGHEFVILAIISNRSVSGKFKYQLPDNVAEVHEVYLEDVEWRDDKGKRMPLSRKQHNALYSLVMNEDVDWDTLFDMFARPHFSVNDLLMGPDFFHIVERCYDEKYGGMVFSDFLWTMRSMYLPLFFTMRTPVPKADLYHCVATGYAGVLGCMGKHVHGSRLLVSEHGIYTREREEELIKARWLPSVFKNLWVEQFRKMSSAAYARADVVTSLYEHARELQVELGCPSEKTRVTPNGINTERLSNLQGKPQDDTFINVGAVLRVTPIKDVKTMIMAFGFAKVKVPNLKLWIMGPVDEDEEYAAECQDLVENMQIRDVVFTGRIDVKDYLGKMDMTILTSISEGQPLTILESYAAKKPVIATDVGNCSGLIHGEDDDFGDAGILTHIMNVEEIANAMIELATDEKKRVQMGINGYNRTMRKYKIEDMKKTYEEIYGALL
jgi:glycosyltransferase involved in cell wall biosynthesis